MSDGTDLFLYFQIIIYPVIGLFAIEMVSRAVKTLNWKKLLGQAFMCVGFGLAYLILYTAHWLTAVVLLALAITLFYQARLSKLNPKKSLY